MDFCCSPKLFRFQSEKLVSCMSGLSIEVISWIKCIVMYIFVVVVLKCKCHANVSSYVLLLEGLSVYHYSSIFSSLWVYAAVLREHETIF